MERRLHSDLWIIASMEALKNDCIKDMLYCTLSYYRLYIVHRDTASMHVSLYWM